MRDERDRCFLEALADQGSALGFRVCAKLAQNSFALRNSHWYDGRLEFQFWPIMETFFGQQLYHFVVTNLCLVNRCKCANKANALRL